MESKRFRDTELQLWTVRVWSMTASYVLDNFIAETPEQAIIKARGKLIARGFSDMAHWNYSAWLKE